MPPENGDGNTLAAENENKQAGTRADGDGNNRGCMYTGNEMRAARARGETQAGGLRAGAGAWARALPWGPPVRLLYALEYWQRRSAHRALRVYQIAPQPHMGCHSIWVVIGGSLTIRLTDVLGRKRTIDFTMGALLPAGLPHSRGRLRPAMLIGGNIFFFREPGAILIRRRREHEGAEPRSYHID
jgi:hypothetical protein